MKFEIVAKVEEIVKRNPNMSETKALTEAGVFSKSLTRNEESTDFFYGDDWVSALFYQINIAIEFVATSVRMGLEIPNIGNDSLVCLAVYNAAKADGGIPTKYACSQEFYRLLMESEI